MVNCAKLLNNLFFLLHVVSPSLIPNLPSNILNFFVDLTKIYFLTLTEMYSLLGKYETIHHDGK